LTRGSYGLLAIDKGSDALRLNKILRLDLMTVFLLFVSLSYEALIDF